MCFRNDRDLERDEPIRVNSWVSKRFDQTDYLKRATSPRDYNRRIMNIKTAMVLGFFIFAIIINLCL